MLPSIHEEAVMAIKHNIGTVESTSYAFFNNYVSIFNTIKRINPESWWAYLSRRTQVGLNELKATRKTPSLFL